MATLHTLHKILDLMWEKGMTEAEFCNAAGINKSAVTDWKKGKTKSYMKHISKIAEVLGVSEDYLLNDSTPLSDKTIVDMSEAISGMADEIVAEDFKNAIKQLDGGDVPKLIEYMKFLISQKEEE